MPKAKQQQHVGIERKLRLRRELLRDAPAGGAYVPFCGDGDIAAALYADRPILAIDSDEARVATFHARLPAVDARVADADKGFPPDLITNFPIERYAVADFDAYAYPYDAFRQFWTAAPKAARLVLFFTDGERLAYNRAGHGRLPDGRRVRKMTTIQKRQLANFYWSRTVQPWFAQAIAPWTVSRYAHYARAHMLYWGAVIDSTAQPARASAAAPATLTARPTDEEIAAVEAALLGAAKAGNMPAIQLWLTNRVPERWGAGGRLVPAAESQEGASYQLSGERPDTALARLARDAQAINTPGAGSEGPPAPNHSLSGASRRRAAAAAARGKR